MKSFIFTLAIVSCFLLSQGLSLESTRTTMLTTLAATTTTSSDETSSAAPAHASAVEVAHPFAKAVTATITTKAPGQQCKEIGSACSVSDECCSRRCIFYRNRCAY